MGLQRDIGCCLFARTAGDLNKTSFPENVARNDVRFRRQQLLITSGSAVSRVSQLQGLLRNLSLRAELQSCAGTHWSAQSSSVRTAVCYLFNKHLHMNNNSLCLCCVSLPGMGSISFYRMRLHDLWFVSAFIHWRIAWPIELCNGQNRTVFL